MSRVKGLRRAAFRAPIALYRWGLGRLVPKRLLLLEHTGRSSGRRRWTVLEVAHHDHRTGAYLVAAGFGPTSHWYRNLQHDPEVHIQVGRRRVAARAALLGPEESGEEMAAYAAHHPRAARRIMSVLGVDLDVDGATAGSADRYREIGRTRIPFVRLDTDLNP